jgi:hypothetical protein
VARYSTTAPYAREDRALAWLRTAPRTSRQIADLLGLTPNHGAALCRRLWLRGKVVREPIDGYQYRYRARVEA